MVNSMDWGLIGHERSVRLLHQAISTSRVAHAYLFTGPRRIGKTTLALAFAQALNCPEDDAPCGRCASCRRIAAGRSIDVRLIQAGEGDKRAMALPSDEEEAGGKRNISIAQIHALQHDAALAPYEGRWKIYILRNADQLSRDAAPALLKTLEEPSRSVVLLLTTTDAKLLPATIVSRCQEMKLLPPSLEAIEAHLAANCSIEPEEAQVLARLSAGQVGWAIEAAKDPTLLTNRQALLGRFIELPSLPVSQRFAVAQELANRFTHDQQTVAEQLALWMTWWRDVLLTKAGCPDLVVNLDRQDLLAQQARHRAQQEIGQFLQRLSETITLLGQNVNPRLALEALMLDLPIEAATASK